ncbi:hypothetical protein Sros_5366 [Streptosporangium roseum DSM 43021]|uniref:Uncharacterized protein n=1 Tax=Streptosporangium roseum (strain ATCC 12428 / DSM 43021 / JCM 3005 / KCTC 9067 / NCIMB 10171 / NRRL 2505 / NI 9100) TaxID=479432 RepID=D2BDN7_STRRD|nr:hypothetical protein Sros_5366 [Streptosporangium roseum DSM 43021]
MKSIYVTASVRGLETLAENFARENAGLPVPLTEEDHARIAAYAQPGRRFRKQRLLPTSPMRRCRPQVECGCGS